MVPGSSTRGLEDPAEGALANHLFNAVLVHFGQLTPLKMYLNRSESTKDFIKILWFFLLR
jgi:hypothetical protein